MKKVIKKLLIIFYIFIFCIFVLGMIFVVISSGKIKPFKNQNGQIIKNSISEKIIVNLNGADNGLIICGKNLENPVLLLISSGPGTSDYFFNEAYPNMNLEDFYTVCYWDYRGMCLVYDKNLNPETITTEQILKDTKAVTDYLKNRFGKEKIFLMGFSGGSHIGLKIATVYPNDYYAYIGLSQSVCRGPENDSLMFDYMEKIFKSRGQMTNLKKLEKSVDFLENGQVICKDWATFVFLLHKAGGGTIKDKSEFMGIIVPIIKARCYTAREKINYIRGMKMYRTTPFYKDLENKDYRNEITKLEIPVYFISGEYDYNCPWPLVEQYCTMLQAPKKAFFKVENAAHSPLWENPEPVVEFLRGVRN